MKEINELVGEEAPEVGNATTLNITRSIIKEDLRTNVS